MVQASRCRCQDGASAARSRPPGTHLPTASWRPPPRTCSTVDLLKVDVERAELAVIKGVRPADWPRIKQAAVEVRARPPAVRTFQVARGGRAAPRRRLRWRLGFRWAWRRPSRVAHPPAATRAPRCCDHCPPPQTCAPACPRVRTPIPSPYTHPPPPGPQRDAQGDPGHPCNHWGLFKHCGHRGRPGHRARHVDDSCDAHVCGGARGIGVVSPLRIITRHPIKRNATMCCWCMGKRAPPACATHSLIKRTRLLRHTLHFAVFA